jgi:RNA polymerase sigma factor (sigma-70 family)
MGDSRAEHVLWHLHRWLGSRSMPAEDGQLLKRFVHQRDEAAFAELVARHGPLVYGLCRRILGNVQDAEDVFQAAFLVLARKAATIRKPGSLSSWLHGVASRLALKARTEAERRRGHEQNVQPVRETEDVDLSWREVRGLIDEELQRLPEKQRLPLVLCYLEGLTQDEAARRLSWPRGTLKRRLEAGGERLRIRLTRRGVTLGTGLFVAALSESASRGAVPTALRSATVQAGMQFVTHETAALVASPAALLAKGALQSMLTTKLKLGAMLVLLIGCAMTAAGLAVSQAPPEKQSENKAEAPAPSRPAEEKRVRKDRYGDPLPAGAIARLGTLRLRHSNMTADAVFTPDSKTVIVSDGAGDVVFWDVTTAREVRRLPRVRGLSYALALTADGKTLAAGADHNLFLWDVATGKMLSRSRVTDQIVCQLLFTPDGKMLAIADGTDTILVWDAVNNRKLHELKGHAGYVAHMALSPDGKTLASGSWRDGNIRLWDLAAGKEKFRISAHEAAVTFVAFSPDGKTLASRGNAADHFWPTRAPGLCFWDAATGAKIREIPNRYPHAFAYFPDGKTMAALEYQRKVQIYDVQTGKPLREYDASPRTMSQIVVSPDGKTVATVWGGSHTFDLWDAKRGKLLHSFDGHRGGVIGLAFAAEGKTLFSAGGHGDYLVGAWNTATGALRGRLGADRDSGNALALSPDGKLLAVGGDSSLILWDTATRKEVHRYNPNWYARRTHSVVSVSWSADGKLLASRSAPDWTIRVWELAANRQRRAIETGPDCVGEIALSPDGAIVAAGGAPDGKIHRWSVADGKELPPIATPQGRVPWLVFSPDGSILASGGEGGGIHLWNPATSRLQRSWDTKAGPITSRLSFSRDGRTIVTGHGDNTVRLWETVTGAERACFIGHHGAVGIATLSRDDRTLASGSADTTILVWDATGGARSDAALSAQQLQELWTDLIGTDANRAYRAMWQMALSPKHALPFLSERLRPITPLDAKLQKQIESLLADLDKESFTVRERAEIELVKMGPAIELALRKALEDKPSLEMRRRIEKVLEKVAGWSGERLRTLRALEAIEHMNTREARRLLESLANGTPRAWLTEEAAAIRRRWTEASRMDPER